MSYKLLALDLDDTLLGESFAISPANREAIQEAARRGVKVTLATGRMYRSTLPYAGELGLDVPLITYHGALVKTSRTGEEIFHCPVPLDLAQEITSYVEEKGYHLNLYVNDNLYVQEDNPMTRLYVDIAKVVFNPVGSLVAFLQEEPTKMTLIIDQEETLRELWSLFHQKYSGQLSVVQSRPFFLEITHARATKGQALKSLASSLGIAREDIIAMGDSYNDLDMIEFAGLGVAVENARPEVKKAADYVAPSNQEDGVARVIEKYILRERRDG